MFGFLNVYKPRGITSHDVVYQLRKATGVKQIGHTGTLDPFAEGVLPVCIGKATRLIEYLEDDKGYIATIQFGKSTDTFDAEGVFVHQSDKKVSIEDINVALRNFEGEITQVPPIYSAIKVGGKKLYEYARAGKEVKIEPRKVNIYKINLINFDEESQCAEISVLCSKGTYIRSIANDLGHLLGCGAYLTKLLRTKAGKFDINSAIVNYTENVEENLINPIDMLPMKSILIDENEHKNVLNGKSFSCNSKLDNQYVILIYNNSVDAVAFIDGNIVKVKKVFV